jgi:SAM-dependent methyltransferase
MKYDPVKRMIGDFVRHNFLLRKLFYKLLGVLFLREWHVKRELRRLLSEKPVMHLFDAGSGFGQYSYYVARKFSGLSILAVDVKEEQVEDCRHFFQKAGLKNVEFRIEDLTKPQHENEFDFIMSVDVMEHIPDDVGVFRNFHRALKPGGRLLVNTPSNLGGSDAHSPDDKSFIEEHARVGYGVDEIRQKLGSVGFHVEAVKFTYGPYGDVAWRLGIKVPMKILNLSRLFFVLLPFYYILALPVMLPLMYMDYISKNKTGAGLIVIARKP